MCSGLVGGGSVERTCVVVCKTDFRVAVVWVCGFDRADGCSGMGEAGLRLRWFEGGQIL